MSEEKIVPVLNGAAETMLQSFYARAMYSKNPKHKFKDKKAEEIVEKLDYDFSRASKDAAMSGGVVARTVVWMNWYRILSVRTRIVRSSTLPAVWTPVFTAWITEKSPGTIWICRKPLR